MAKKNSDDLFDILRARGLRRSVAKAISEAQDSGKSGGRKAESLARDALGDLRAASDAIRTRLIDSDDAKRSAAGKKAAATRKRNATKRSTAAKKAAQTRAKSSSSGRSRAKSGSR